MSKISGSCLCGSVQYASKEEPLMTAVCHCENCQHQTGTAFSIIVGVPEDSLVFEKSETLKEYIDHGESGGAVRRNFCEKCGSPIFSLVESAPGISFIKAGTLDDKSWLQPSTNFWCDTAQPWVKIDDELANHDRNPT
jgi:hypothetical protein